MAAFGDDMISNLESNPMFRKWFEEDEEFHKKILEVQKNPMPMLSQIMSAFVENDALLSQYLSTHVPPSVSYIHRLIQSRSQWRRPWKRQGLTSRDLSPSKVPEASSGYEDEQAL